MPDYRPPASARMFAYLGITAYEAALPDMPEYRSLKTFFPAYTCTAGLPEQFKLEASLNAAYAQALRRYFYRAPTRLLRAIDIEENANLEVLSKNIPFSILENSAAYGRAVAEAVWSWSATDSMGHDAFLRNYDERYKPPAGTGSWVPCGPFATPPVLPYWGHVRPFLIAPYEIQLKSPIAFDEKPGSPFYAEAFEVLMVSRSPSEDNRWIAEFWSDDLPGLTLTPAGRWISIATQLMESRETAWEKILETYLRIGIALADGSVVCWNAKYKYNLERPESYIRRVIEPNWKPMHDTPSFPSYPSGHAVFGAAATAVLIDQFGDKMAFTDRTHIGRKEFEGRPRHFNSLTEMMQENAYSRVPLGVHYRMDCSEGIRLGTIVGQVAVQMQLKNNQLSQAE